MGSRSRVRESRGQGAEGRGLFRGEVHAASICVGPGERGRGGPGPRAGGRLSPQPRPPNRSQGGQGPAACALWALSAPDVPRAPWRVPGGRRTQKRCRCRTGGRGLEGAGTASSLGGRGAAARPLPPQSPALNLARGPGCSQRGADHGGLPLCHTLSCAGLLASAWPGGRGAAQQGAERPLTL